MSLVTYQQARRYSSRIVYRTGLRDVAGAMPPWYVEKDIGIQHHKNDPSLNDLEVSQITAWVENGMPEGNPADMPPPRGHGMCSRDTDPRRHRYRVHADEPAQRPDATHGRGGMCENHQAGGRLSLSLPGEADR